MKAADWKHFRVPFTELVFPDASYLMRPETGRLFAVLYWPEPYSVSPLIGTPLFAVTAILPH